MKGKQVDLVKWSDIVAEVGNYRDGFVAVFRKYEGMATDERDASNRVVKVTGNSFARHMGIPLRTFNDWVRKVQAEAAPTRGPAERNRQLITNTTRRDPIGMVDAIQAAGTAAEDQVFHELKLRRAGVDTSTANRKAAGAAAHQLTQPFRTAAASTKLALVAPTLREIAADLREALAEGSMTAEYETDIREALADVQIAFAEAVFSIS